MRTDPGRHGFTLLELIITMSLLAVIAGICYSAFHLGMRVMERGEAAVVTAQRLRAATDVLIRQVKSIALTPARVVEGDSTLPNAGDSYPFFVGKRDIMTFVTDAGQLDGGGRALVTYRVQADPPALIMEETPYFDADTLGGSRRKTGTNQSEPRTAIVLDGFRSLSLEYQRDEGAGDVEWLPAWDYTEEEMLPSAVHIVVDGLPGLGASWDQTIPIMSGPEPEDDYEPQECEADASAGTGSETGTPHGSGKGGADDEGPDDE
jgi:prepilin-type N-terminal cleavage/methylation domain-containing protein